LLSNCDPFTYAVHGVRTALLKNVGIGAITNDIFALALTSAVVLAGATLLFRRTL
jgi:ABC-type multidrug transport system permease subunit